MDYIAISRNKKVKVNFGEGTIIQNDTHTIYEELTVTEVDTDKAHAVITGGNRARLNGELIISQNYTDNLTVPCWDIFDEYKPAYFVDGTPPPTEVYLLPNTVQNTYFENVAFGVHDTNRQYEAFFISRTGKDGSWFRIEGKETILVKGMVYFKLKDNSRPISISISDSIGTADRINTIMDFTATYGANMSVSGAPITGLTYDPDTAILTGTGEGPDVELDLTNLRDGEGELLLASDIGEDLTMAEFKAIVANLPKAGNYTYNNSDDANKAINYVALRSATSTVVFEVNGLGTVSVNSSDL